ncbi:MAG: hypothetical protein JSU63_08585, partial [Phycisphaerales bacterium]
NRLMYYEVYDTDPDPDELVSTTWYYYNDWGNVTRVVTNEDGTTAYSAARMAYAANGRAVTYAIGEDWTWDGENDPANYNIDYAQEFRYDGARQRYLVREFDPEDLNDSPPVFTVSSEMWSDYAANTVYGDYTGSGATVTEEMSYELGIGEVHYPTGVG